MPDIEDIETDDAASSGEFRGEITVASRIVDQLSSGLYESPAACLKELINNAYDADAKLVEVFVKPDANRIIIADDGLGMNRAEFVRHFKRVSESHKREESDRTPGGRAIIGKIGIGFIAANEICDTMEIFSTQKNSRALLHVFVHFARMREDPAARRRKGDAFAKGDYEGEVLTADASAHYTEVVLRDVRKPELFASAKNLALAEPPRTLYGKSPASVLEELSDPHLRSWSDFDTYSQNLLKVALNVPVSYYPNWMPKRGHSAVAEFETATRRLDFHVKYDGSELHKPIVLRPPLGKDCLVSPFHLDGEHVAASGYFYAQHGTMRPTDIQGLLLRIRNAAVGGYRSDFLDFPRTEGSLIQRWISAEVWADDRLEPVMNIDRSTLRATEPAFLELQQAIHDHLRSVIAEARSKLYRTGSEERKRTRAAMAIDDVRLYVAEEIAPYDKESARQVMATWNRASRDDDPTGRLLRKYSVVELYELVIDVARETMTKEQLATFVRLLTQRLAK